MIGLLGLNHKSAPIEVRERFVFCEEDIKRFVPLLIEKGISGAVVLSTCNRTEIYYEKDEQITSISPQEIENVLFTYRKADFDTKKYFYHQENETVASHLFRVASGLDSMALGEYQVVTQIKEALQISKSHNLMSCVLTKLFNDALKTGKQIRTDTLLNKGAVSISYAGVELAAKKLHPLSAHPVLLIGAGQTGELTLQNLVQKACTKLTIINRTKDKAIELAAKYNSIAGEFDQLEQLLIENDIIITSTASHKPLINTQMVMAAMTERNGKPLLFIDLSVPRNVEVEVGQLDQVHVYDVDDLKAVIENNLEKRKGEIALAERIIEESVAEYSEWLNIRALAPTFQTITAQFQEVSKSVLEVFSKNLNESEVEQAIEYGDIITRKLIRLMIENIKSVTDNGSKREYIPVVNQLFSQN